MCKIASKLKLKDKKLQEKPFKMFGKYYAWKGYVLITRGTP